MTRLLGLVRNPDGRPPTSDTAPRIDYGAVVEAVNGLRRRRNAISVRLACELLGIPYWDYNLARKHVATDEEAFEDFSWHEKIGRDERIVRGGA